MLNVNTIEFNGRKACINSYSDHPALVESMNRQVAFWSAKFPKATVKTERMSRAECIKLVGDPDANRNLAWEIGSQSMAEG